LAGRPVCACDVTDWYTVLILSGVWSITAIGMQLGLMSGAFSNAPVGWMALGAYASAIGARDWDVDPLLMALPTMAVAFVGGALLALPARRVQGLYFALMTLAFVLCVQSVARNIQITGGPYGIFGIPLATNGLRVIAALGFAALVAVYVSTGNRGRIVRACGQDPLVARSLGVNTRIVYMVIGGTAASLSVLAGSLYVGFVGFIEPTLFGFAATVSAVLMVMIGGRKSWLGAIIGATFVTALPEVLRSLAGWRDVVNGSVLILVTVFASGGLLELALRAARPLRRLRPKRTISERPTPAIAVESATGSNARP
jgi:branched-chain amino acid transport system permease protein